MVFSPLVSILLTELLSSSFGPVFSWVPDVMFLLVSTEYKPGLYKTSLRQEKLQPCLLHSLLPDICSCLLCHVLPPRLGSLSHIEMYLLLWLPCSNHFPGPELSFVVCCPNLWKSHNALGTGMNFLLYLKLASAYYLPCFSWQNCFEVSVSLYSLFCLIKANKIISERRLSLEIIRVEGEKEQDQKFCLIEITVVNVLCTKVRISIFLLSTSTHLKI